MQQLFTNHLEEVSKHNSKENPKLHTLLIAIKSLKVSKFLQIHHQNHCLHITQQTKKPNLQNSLKISMQQSF